MSDSGRPWWAGLPAELFREADDAGIVYRAQCGDFHWRCYDCTPSVRSDHFATQADAVASFEAHQRKEHP